MSRRIVRIEVGIVDVPLTGVFATAHSSRTSQGAVVVRVADETGAAGWGSVEPTRGYSKASVGDVARAARAAAPAVVGQDGLNFAMARHRMRRAGAVPEAAAVVEMALFDLAGRALGVPAWRLLGGALRDSVALNGWIGVVSAGQAASEAAAWVERGFASVKVKVGHDLRADVDRVAAIRMAGGPGLGIRVDANEGLDVEGAVRLARAIEPYDVALLEQPVPRDDVEGLAAVRRRVRVPIMADEAVEGPKSVVRISRCGAADLVKVKVMKQGGLLPTLETIQVAAAAGLGVVIGHGFGLWLSTMAELQVAAVSAAVADGVECVGPLKMRDHLVRGRPAITEGRIRLPETPGLGVEPDEGALEAHGWRPEAVTG